MAFNGPQVDLTFTIPSNAQLSPKEEEYLTFLSNLYPNGALREVYLLDNHQAYPDGTGIKGAIFVFDPKAKVREAAPFNARSFGHVMEARLAIPANAKFDESSARQKLHDEIPNLVPPVSSKPYRLANQLLFSEGKINPTDSEEWQEALGGHGSFIAFSKQYVRNMINPIYHVVVNSQQDQIGEELVAYLRNNDATFTFEELLNNPAYLSVKSVSKRNAQRILYQAANLLGGKVQWVDDIDAMVNDQQFEVQPTLALPDVHSPYNYMRQMHFKGQDSVVYYSHATCLADNLSGVIQMVNPTHGMRIYLASPNFDYSEFGPFFNDVVNSFPTGVARITNSKILQTNKRMLESVQNLKSFAESTFSWYGKKQDQKEQEQKPPTSPADNERTYIYGSMNSELEENLVNKFGAKNGYISLEPIAVMMPKPRPDQIYS